MIKEQVMKKLIIFFAIMIAINLFADYKYPAEIKINSLEDFNFIEDSKILIDEHSLRSTNFPMTVEIYVDADELNFLKDKAFEVTSKKDRIDRYCEVRTNEEVGEELLALEETHPDICKRFVLGNSVEGRPIWGIKISDNVEVEEAEPEFKYTATMHGDEVVPMELMMNLVHDLVEGYEADNDTMNFIIDNTELFIVPLHNPDGRHAHTRSNANGVDLNRNFPDRTGDNGESQENDPNGYVDIYGEVCQVENIGIMNLNNDHNFVLSSNLHNGSIVVNYPWDHLPGETPGLPNNYSDCPDDDFAVYIANEYASHNTEMAESSEFENGITNGASWYQISGSMQDWNYHYYGDLEETFEVSYTKWPTNYSYIEERWLYNRTSMIMYILGVHSGIKGLITDAETNQPIAANFQIEGINKVFTNDLDFGDYYKLLTEGTYNLVVSAEGYETEMIENIEVVFDENSFDNTTTVNVALQPLPDNEAPTVESVSSLVAPVGEELNFTVNIYEVHQIASVEGIYNFNGQEGSITLTPAKDRPAYSYQGTIPAQEIPCEGSIYFNLTDNSGNNGQSESYDINIATANIFNEGFESGDFTSFDWIQGDNPWVITENSHEGVYAAKSGEISDNAESSISLNVHTLQDTVKFYYKTSTEGGYDKFNFYIDDVLKKSSSGENDWKEAIIPIESGEHELKWSYTKDSGTASGDDCVYLDELRIGKVLTLGIAEEEALIAKDLKLYQNYPNPFNNSTMISYSLQNSTMVNLSIYNASGQLVEELVNKVQKAGNYKLSFNAANYTSGIYYTVLKSNESKLVNKMIFLK